MAIEFPQPKMGNPFDRWQWVRPAKPPQQTNFPNLARPGQPANCDTLNPGIPIPKNRLHSSLNVINVNGAPAPISETTAIYDSASKRTFYKITATQNMVLNGVSRDRNGAVLGSCRVMVFRTQDMTLVAETTSDVSGVWSLPLMVSGPFFLVEYKVGPPDVAGTSGNTLLPEVA